MTFLNTIISNILNIIFPVSCVGCGKAGSHFCINCLSAAPLAERESAKWIFPIFDYRHPSIKKALRLFKYKGRRIFAKIFAEVMYDKIIEELSELSIIENFRAPILIPIPLSRKRYKERGYNQAELICKELVKLDKNINFELGNNVLIKPKDTKHQAHIENRTERMKNIIGSFAIKNKQNAAKNTSSIKNRNIILIDDILTTGATLNEAKKILKQAGARKVIAFTVAH